jgi:hypothetical protein
MSARKFSADHVNRIEIKLSPRQLELRNFAENNELAYFPQRIKTAAKYKDFPIHNGHKIPFEENMLVKYGDFAKVEISDITIQQGARQSQQEWSMTIVQLSDMEVSIPDFALEPEGLFSKLFETLQGRDIDFDNHPVFSKKYYLRSNNEEAVRAFFTEPILQFLENREEMHIECHRNRLVFFKKRELLQPSEILYTSKFAEEFISLISKKNVVL